MLRLARWRMKKNIEFRLDHSSPLAASHHHKILVIDDKVAFCGGIDMTASRWDTRAHRDHDPGRRRPTTGRRYGPWHDTTMAVDGAAARALGDLARSRWELACGTCLEPAAEGEDPWPRALEPDFRDVPLAIARTRAKAEEWAEIREIEALFVDMIASASRFVYVETQYFASRVVAEAIAKRLAEPDGPEFLIVNPKTGHDWLDEGVMGPARAQLVRVLEKADPGGRFRIYTPVTEKGADIYVHAKLMIVDDVMLRVGSANMNNRSMGLDSECDLLVDSRLCEDPAAGEAIAAIRTGLLAEHLGRRTEEVESCFEETGSLIAAVERLRARKGRTLLPFVPPETNKLQEQLADSEALDPESADQPFEPLAGSRLLARLRRFGRRGG
jgi:phospholipase D1/2